MKKKWGLPDAFSGPFCKTSPGGRSSVTEVCSSLRPYLMSIFPRTRLSLPLLPTTGFATATTPSAPGSVSRLTSRGEMLRGFMRGWTMSWKISGHEKSHWLKGSNIPAEFTAENALGERLRPNRILYLDSARKSPALAVWVDRAGILEWGRGRLHIAV